MHDEPERDGDYATAGFTAAIHPQWSSQEGYPMAWLSWSGLRTGVHARDEGQEAATTGGHLPRTSDGGYFGCSGRSRSVPLVGLRSGVPGAF
jgi:hypothetical protein